MYKKQGFVIDLNGITRREYIEWRQQRNVVDDQDLYDIEMLYGKIVQSWPFDVPVTVDGFLSLGFADSLLCEQVVGEAIEDLNKKK